MGMDAVFDVAVSGLRSRVADLATAASRIAGALPPLTADPPAPVAPAPSQPGRPNGEPADVDLSDQMVVVMLAVRGAQADVAVIQRADEAYRSLLDLGR